MLFPGVTPEAAFDYLVDPRNRLQWQSSLARVEDVDGSPRVGQTWVDVTTPGLRPRMETTHLDRPHRWTERGIILADTKLELGRRLDGSGTVVLGDEVLTPDSSRFWPADAWTPGRPQASYDKQIVRNWALSPESGWDRTSGEAPPPLPPEVVDRTRARYVEAYELLTGERW